MKEIDNYKSEWDYVKKYANPCRFVHTKIPGHRTAVCKYQPISRSFFKLYEILDVFFLMITTKTLKYPQCI